MAQMAQGKMPTGWGTTKITCEQGISTADQLLTWVQTVAAQYKIAFFALDRDEDVFPPVKTIVSILWHNTNLPSYSTCYERAESNYYQCRTQWGSNYDTIVAQGATFTVFYMN